MLVLWAGVGSRDYLKMDHGQLDMLIWPSVKAAQVGERGTNGTVCSLFRRRRRMVVSRRLGLQTLTRIAHSMSRP